jgi:hypothetical protein
MSERKKTASAPARGRSQQKTKDSAEQLPQPSELDKINEAYASLKGTASVMSDEVRAANETYGGLREGVHIAGYAFARAMYKLEWLLTEDRWREAGFDDVNTFLDSLQLDELRMVAEQRKRIAKRIKELTAEASNRSIARALGVSHQTVYNDLAVKKLTAEPGKTQQKQHAGAGKWRTADEDEAEEPDAVEDETEDEVEDEDEESVSVIDNLLSILAEYRDDITFDVSRWLEYGLSPADKQRLAHVLHALANEITVLAQKMDAVVEDGESAR